MFLCRTGGMADAEDSKSSILTDVPVQVRGSVFRRNPDTIARFRKFSQGLVISRFTALFLCDCQSRLRLLASRFRPLLVGKLVGNFRHAATLSFHVLDRSRRFHRSDLKKLLSSIDRFTPQGKKVYAAIVCQTDLCMRLGDVARITLDDIDWREGKIQINNHKGGTPYWLPLPHRVGVAIADYLKNARPASDSRILFLSTWWWRIKSVSTYHPFHEINLQWEIAGLKNKYSGTRLLRHYGATQMKQKKCSIKVISDILGHTTLQTTAIYAKVDVPALRQVAQEWPGKEVPHEN